MAFSNTARVRQEIATLAGRHTPPMYKSWEEIPYDQRLLILEHIDSVIQDVTREASELLRIETELAKQRMSDGPKGVAISPQVEGDARDKVAKTLGIGAKMRPFRVRIDFGTSVNTVIVSARNAEEAFEESKRVLRLEGKDVDGTVTPQ